MACSRVRPTTAGASPAASPTPRAWTAGPLVADRLHWPVTEAIGAAAALHAVTGEARYEHWYRTCWDFAGAHLIDRARGSWHAELDDGLQPSEQTWSGKPDVYHSLQATLIPRLPVSPSLAGALRDGPLA